MDSYKIVLEEEGIKRELDVTPEQQAKGSKSRNANYSLSEKGKNLGRLVFKNGKYHYEGDEKFSPDDIHLITLSITNNQKEMVIDSEEDNIEDEK
ncbi:hypothetical protein HH214_21250 [Mucilaginibacter robiniae]|uniref:Uncharacterized protein n=1 Tax=Mucilaginibacter robiniae TaxID=2728022 RepID=A0A7L5EBA2_9SPHI|nr:hypothetical protein [Mucilaginibacter robiniae]QJD98223.1 hypothetical protein HH214_21250 [Mucilaginibacter robiniae]